jgi:hypothetical protein
MNWIHWLTGKSRDVPPKPELLGAPGAHVLIPGALSVLVENHDLRVDPNGLGTGPKLALPGKGCRSYLTHGLGNFGQREVMFVVAPDGAGVTVDCEQDVVRLYHRLFQYARDSHKIEAGDLQAFAGKGPFALSGCGIAYLNAVRGPGPAVPEDALLAMLLQADECAAAQVAGVHRAAAWIARASRLFPYPKFSELSRPSAVPPGLPASMLLRVPLMRSAKQAEAFLQNKTLTVRMEADLWDGLSKTLRAVEANPYFGILTGYVPAADGRFVWLPKDQGLEAIGPIGSKLSIMEGGFVIFAGGQPSNTAMVVEDGFSVLLTSDSWSALKAAAETRSEIEFPITGGDDRFVKQLRIETKKAAV